jgi:hypothetical protein
MGPRIPPSIFTADVIIPPKAESDTGYEKAVAEAKEILAKIESSRERLMRVGELAANVEKLYGEQSLKRFAADIGMPACTLARCRSVFRAWAGKEAPAPVSFAVAQELQRHPDRFELVAENPNMTI